MAKVQLRKNEDFNQLLRRFKRAVDEEKIIQEARERQTYEKPTMKRKLAKKAAVRRHQRKVDAEKARHSRKY